MESEWLLRLGMKTWGRIAQVRVWRVGGTFVIEQGELKGTFVIKQEKVSERWEPVLK